MRQQSGNLLMQALLALTVVFAFIPFLTSRFAGRDASARMFAASRQIEVASTAARIFVRENARQFPYETTVVSGDSFADMLEPYGLPLGYVPRTALGQDIALVIIRDTDGLSAYLELTGGNLSGLQRAELARRVGFYADSTDNSVVVGIPLDTSYSDVVRRNEPDLDAAAFLTELDMGGYVFDNVGRLNARRGDFETGQFGTLAITGTENGRKVRSKIKTVSATKTVFQTRTGQSALSLTRGTLGAGYVSGRTVSAVGDTGNLTVADASVYDFAMTAGRASFTGPANWKIGGNIISNNMNFTVERLDVNSYINVSRGQDVYISDDLVYSTRSGIEVSVISAANITLRDQTSSALAAGGTGDVVIDIRPAETSFLPDALVADINNDAFQILANPSDSGADTVECRTIITRLGGRYNRNSLAQNIVCQYVYWSRLEKRIDIKQCLMAGKSGCM